MAQPAPSAPASPSTLHVRNTAGGVLVLTLPAIQRFDALRLSLRELLDGDVPDAGPSDGPVGRFRGASLRLDLGERELDLLEMRRLVHLLKDEYEIQVVGLQCRNESLQRMAERELKLKVHVPAPPAPVAPVVPEPVEEAATDMVSPPAEEEPAGEPEEAGRVHVVHGTVRSGGVVRFSGDIQVFGDVNPGAHLVAGGNVVVLGALKGMAHAGARGDDRAVIVALDLRPTQVRIGNVIGLTLETEPDRPGRGWSPEIASVVGSEIVIEPYAGFLKRGRLQHTVVKETP